MIYADSISKGFLSYGQPRSAISGNKMLAYEDPTYVGFQWRILNSRDFTRTSGDLDLDYYPQGLFLQNEDPDSAYSYFMRTNQRSRAQMISEFRDGFLEVLKNAPWYFTKVSGLGDIWKITPGNSFRGKEKKISIETFEAIDLKITYLLDLYRKAVYDPFWMRYALPENQRMFAMELVVGEIRPLQISQEGYANLTNSPNSYPGVIDPLGGAFQTLDSSIDQKAKEGGSNTFRQGPNFPEFSLVTNVKDILRALKPVKTPVNSSYPTIKAPWSPATFLSFRFDLCTFDVFTQAPPFLEDVGKTPGEAAKNMIVINTPYISESNSYGLLGAILKDSFYQGDYEYNINDTSTGTPKIMQTLGEGSNTGVRNQLKTKQQQNPILRRLSQAAEARIRNVVERAFNKVFLGNVYRFSAASTVNRIQGLLNNPVSTVGDLIREFGGNEEQRNGPPSPANVGLTGQEVDLVREIIGIAVEDGFLTNESLVKEVIGTSVEDSTSANENLVKKEIGKTVEDEVLINPDLVKNTLGNAKLTAAEIVKARLTNVYKQ